MRQSLAACFRRAGYACVLTKVQLSPEESEIPGLVAMVNYGRKKQCDARR